MESRNIIFRGIKKDGSFTYGYLLSEAAIGTWGNQSHYTYAEVAPDSVGQFSGLFDKNGVEIYEGDICEVDNNENANHLQTVNCNYAKQLKKGDLLIIKNLLSGFTGQILTNQGDAPNLIGNVCNYSLWNGARQLVVIGNIYQNPELLTPNSKNNPLHPTTGKG